MIGEGGGRSQHPQQPVPQRLGRYQRVEQLPPGGVPGLRLQQPDETVQGEIGIGGVPEGLQQNRIVAHRGQLGPVEQPLGG